MSSSKPDLIDFSQAKPAPEQPKASGSSLDAFAAAFSIGSKKKQTAPAPTVDHVPEEPKASGSSLDAFTAAFSIDSRKKQTAPAPTVDDVLDSPSKPKALPPIVTSKEAPEVEDEDPDSPAAPAFEYPKVKIVLEGCDETLRQAFSSIIGEIAEEWIPQLDGVAPGDLESHRSQMNSDDHRTELYTRLGTEYKKRKASSGETPSEEEIRKIKKQIVEHENEMVDHIIDTIFRLAKERSDEGDSREAMKRKRLNHVLRLERRKATCYELLGVEPGASGEEIKAAWYALSKIIHPDHNKDKAANAAMSAINGAYEVLKDTRKRSIYDNFLKNNPPPKASDEFDEGLAPNAFGDEPVEEEEEEDDDEDSASDTESQYPPPPKAVKKQHEKMTPMVEAFFKELDTKGNASILTKIEARNVVIEKDNVKNKRRVVKMYVVPKDYLLHYQFAQRRIAVHFETGLWDAKKVSEEAEKLLQRFLKTRSRGLFQWPEIWTNLLFDPLVERLYTLGLPKPSEPHEPRDDVTMDSDISEDDDSEPETLSPRAQAVPTRTLQPLRAGFTMLGDQILGYMPVERRSKYMPGESILTGFKMFVKVKQTGLFKFASGNDVGSMAALAYHQLPDHQKNDIRKNAQRYSNLSPSDFKRILGVDWIPGTAQPGRLPVTYVWCEMQRKSKHADIMTRTLFRDWLTKGIADKLIDDWLVTNNIVPEWSLLGFRDPANDRKYLALTYPAPSIPRYDMRPRIQYGDMPRIQGGDMPRIQGGDIQALTDKFNSLLQFVIEDRREAREERKQQQQMMRMLLPGPAR